MSENKSASNCLYKIVTGSTLDELEKRVNEIIAQPWNADGSVKGQWEIHGDIGEDGNGFFQVLINCPVQMATAARKTEE